MTAPATALPRRWPRIALPSLCPACEGWSPSAGICLGCQDAFAPPLPRCPGCALPWSGPTNGSDGVDGSTGSDRDVCPDCRRRAPLPRRCVAAVDYRFPWDALVRRFKFAGDVALAPALAEPMVQALRRSPAVAADLVLPIPLAAARLRERGFNQAWELARRIAGPLGLQAEASLLLRRRETASQARATPAERLANMRAAFAVGARERVALRGRRVLLVDDVMTTGATLAAATQALLDAGAADVQACVFARTPRSAADGT